MLEVQNKTRLGNLILPQDEVSHHAPSHRALSQLSHCENVWESMTHVIAHAPQGKHISRGKGMGEFLFFQIFGIILFIFNKKHKSEHVPKSAVRVISSILEFSTFSRFSNRHKTVGQEFPKGL